MILRLVTPMILIMIFSFDLNCLMQIWSVFNEMTTSLRVSTEPRVWIIIKKKGMKGR